MSNPKRDSADSEHDAVDGVRRQAEFEMEFLGRILDRYPDYLDVLRRRAELLSAWGRRAEAVECDERIVALLPNDPLVRYHLACDRAVLGRFDEAVDSLRRAIELGYRDFDRMEADPDLDVLRKHPAYQALLKAAHHS